MRPEKKRDFQIIQPISHLDIAKRKTGNSDGLIRTFLNKEKVGLERKKVAQSGRDQAAGDKTVLDVRFDHIVPAFFFGAPMVRQGKSALNANAEFSGPRHRGLDSQEHGRGENGEFQSTFHGASFKFLSERLSYCNAGPLSRGMNIGVRAR